MTGIERDNPALKDVLPKDYARPALDKQRLGQLIDLISNIQVGDAEARSKDVLGRVYEYFLSQFASAEGKKGGEFYTPRCVVTLLVEMLEPYQGRVYDPVLRLLRHVRAVGCLHPRPINPATAIGSSAPQGTKTDISIYGQESNYTTWRPGQDEPRHSRHRGPDRPRRHLPHRPSSRPQGRLYSGQPALQYLRLGAVNG